jgi:hypothetical protein
MACLRVSRLHLYAAAAFAKHKEMDCVCYENPTMGIFFIEDPGGYWLEIIPQQRSRVEIRRITMRLAIARMKYMPAREDHLLKAFRPKQPMAAARRQN